MAQKLIDAGVDVLIQHQSSKAVLVLAEKNDIYAIGVGSDMEQEIPQSHLVSVVWNWSNVYSHILHKLYKGKWTNQTLWLGLESKAISLVSYNKDVSKEVQNFVKEKIYSGKFKVFTGPIQDQNGTLKLKENTTFTDKELLSMMFLVEGIEGKLPEGQ